MAKFPEGRQVEHRRDPLLGRHGHARQLPCGHGGPEAHDPVEAQPHHALGQVDALSVPGFALATSTARVSKRSATRRPKLLPI
jgi:hypothetical protein